MKFLTAFTSLLCAISTLSAAEQNIPSNQGTVDLPEGFKYISQQGYDSVVGVFEKEGEKVNFDFGPIAGIYVDKVLRKLQSDKEKVVVVRNSSMKLNGLDMRILVYSHGTVKGAVVSYPATSGNFFCEYRDDGDLVDFLSLALSYRPIQNPEEQGHADHSGSSIDGKPEK